MPDAGRTGSDAEKPMNAPEQPAAAERLVGLDSPDTDQVAISFDWLVPYAGEPLTFTLDVTRRARTSAARFQIDLAKLAQADLEQLHAFLTLQHSGIRDDYTFTRCLTWLLDLSLRQSSPMSLPERQVAVRQTLLML
jgi:hypothetical protein